VVENGKVPRERANLLSNLQAAVFHDEEGGKRYPQLSDLLTPRIKDGRLVRQAGVMSVTVEGGAVRVTIRCEEEGLQCVGTFDTLHDLLKRVESFVTSQHAVWTLTYNAKKKLDKPTSAG
jgi:hypothetical protein